MGPGVDIVVDDLLLEASHADETNNGGSKVTPTLSGEDGSLKAEKKEKEKEPSRLDIDKAREEEPKYRRRTIILPRVRVAANSEVMTADRG